MLISLARSQDRVKDSDQIAEHFIEKRNGCGRSVAVLNQAVQSFFKGNPALFTYRLDDPQVGAVRDEPIDAACLQTAFAQKRANAWGTAVTANL
jgi:hypothetical protein